MKVALFDIDGTLADATHRLHFIQGESKNWTGFFDAMVDDTPVEPICQLLRWSFTRARIVLLTGRPQSHVHQTVAWMRQHNLPFDHLWMRETNDHRPDTEVKPELFEKTAIPVRDVLFAVEDRPSVARVYRQRFGFMVLQTNDVEF